MLILTLKIGQRLYVSQSAGFRLIVEVVDVVRHDINHISVRFEIKTHSSRKIYKKLSSKKCSDRLINAASAEKSNEYLAPGCFDEVFK